MRILKSGTYENMFKMAFPVKWTPEEEAGLQSEGIYPITDPELAETDTLPGGKSQKRTIRDIIGSLSLPRIVYPTAKHIIEIDGRQYYLLDIAEPKPKKNPEGTVYLLDLQTGRTENKPFMPYADQIASLKRDQIRHSNDEINARINSYNAKIDKIKGVENPSTWPLQLVWAKDIITGRISELTGQEDALKQQLDASTNFSPSYSASVERMKSDIAAGRITDIQDLKDTLVFVHLNDPDSVEGLINSAPIPDDIKTKLRNIFELESANKRERDQKREMDESDRSGRMNTDTDYGVLRPGMQETVTLSPVDIEQRIQKTKLPTPDQYFSPQGRTKQIRASLIGVRRNKTMLESISGSMDELREFVGSLAKGERARAVLMNPERGMEIKRKIADFVNKVNAFNRGYKVDVLVMDDQNGTYSVNPKLLGPSGKGNGEVAIAVNQISSIVMHSLKAHATDEPEPINLLDFGQEELMAYLPEDMPE